MWKKILLLIIPVLFINSISAQKSGRRVEITGTVYDVYNSPIADAIIMIDGQKTGAMTNSRGKYKIRIKPDASTIGVFTIGNGTYESYIDGRTHINFNSTTILSRQLNPNLSDREQAVNTGYGNVKKKNLTTNINKIDGTDKKYSTYTSLTEMIQREVSGVQVYGNDIVIQGSSNLNGYVYPLVVLDGVYMDHLPDIPPTTVKSIEVLKDGSASIYGSRAFGGVIIIKTKLRND